MTAEQFVIGGIVALAWWHRDKLSYVLAGFALLIYGLTYAGAIDDSTIYISSLLIILGIYSFFKAAWDRRDK